MLEKLKSLSDRMKEKHQTLWEMLVFWLIGAITTVVDLAVFALCNYWLFAGYRDAGFVWWLLDYSVPNGGLCAFLSFAISYAVSQAVHFVIQRDTVFGATNNIWLSGFLYAVLVIGAYFVILWVPTLYQAWLYAAIGESWGAMVSKVFTELLSFFIQFPACKWIICRV